MNVFRNAGKLLATLIFVLAICAVANAQTSTFVSSTGSDGSPGCPRTAPCRTLQIAVNTVLSGGTVIVLDSAGYGTLAIGKSVSIYAPSGVNAAVNATSGTAISITAGTVLINGLQVNGSGTAAAGIALTGGSAIVTNCSITGFTTGVSTLNTKMDLINSNLFSNTTAVVSNGSGANSPGNPATTSVSLIRISGGNIIGNGTGLSQVNPGTFGSPNPQNLFNIAVFSAASNTGASVNLIGNTTNTTCSGTANCSTFPILYFLNSLIN
jgi:hypothetical protein